LCAPHFFAWKKRLREAEASQFVEVKVVATTAVAAATTHPILEGGLTIEVRLKNERRLLVGPGFDAQHLRALLAVVESGA
jgi:hypothetical protein